MMIMAAGFEEYKFSSVYKFADIIYQMVESEVGFWDYDEEQVVSAITCFNKLSLLHIYIYTQLLNHFGKIYGKYIGFYEGETFEAWEKIAQSYGLAFYTDYYDYEDDDNDHKPFYHWYMDNESVFKELFQFITEEVFFILFSNHSFLVKFNKIVSLLLADDEEYRSWYKLRIPDDLKNPNGTIKRCNIPEWVKKAVFHRDHGRCVFCGKDLTGVYSHSNKVNFDHIIPLNRYGANDPCNIQTTCEQCNKSKQDRLDNPQYKYEPWW